MYWITVGKRSINLELACIITQTDNGDIWVEFPASNDTGNMSITLEGEDAEAFAAYMETMSSNIDTKTDHGTSEIALPPANSGYPEIPF